MKPYAPLGILYLSSYLRAQGFDVEVYDSTFGSREELFRILETERPRDARYIRNLMTRAQRDRDHRAREGRAAGAWSWAARSPPAIARSISTAGADVVIAGRRRSCRPCGVRLVEESVDRRRRGATPAPLIADLDAQPWPDRERVDIDRYLQVWRERHGTGSVSVITARGCPYHCRWCSHSTFGKTHRRRSPEAWWMKWSGSSTATSRTCCGSPTTYSRSITAGSIEYAAEMKRRGLRIPFECITRADRLNDRSRRRARGARLLPRVDRLGERLAADSRRDGARRHRGAGARRPSD